MYKREKRVEANIPAEGEDLSYRQYRVGTYEDYTIGVYTTREAEGDSGPAEEETEERNSLLF